MSFKIVLIGRPNVGKSALFNRICQQKIAIVDDEAGITRDRIYANAELFGARFTVIDTGGIDPRSKAPFQKEVEEQSMKAIDEADGAVLVVDGQVGLTPLDRDLARMLLAKQKPLVLAVNKIDSATLSLDYHEFYGLGIEKMVAVSAVQGLQIEEMLSPLLAHMPDQEIPVEEVAEEERALKVAIIGRPNAGKSTLFNRLLGENRSIVSPLAGTTRDAIDVPVEIEGQKVVFIDTAGLRRRKSDKKAVEQFASMRTHTAISRCDVCLFVADVSDGITIQERRILHDIEERGKSCILLFNKWDLVTGFRMEHALKELHEQIPFLAYCPTLFISAETGRNVEKIVPLLKEVFAQRGHRIGTGPLNQFMENAIQKNHPPMLQGKRLRIYYLTQVEVAPPKFALFVNNQALMVDSYKKYLINQFRAIFPFRGTPLKFELRSKK